MKKNKLKENMKRFGTKNLKEQSDFNPPTNKPLGKSLGLSDPYMNWSRWFSPSNPDKDFINKFTGEWFLMPTEEGSNELSIIVNVPEMNGHLKIPVRTFVQ
jgi:hypothetical protein